ncbi:hypothetical protein ACFL40_04115 [candidate division KSB1 bacterium]
MKKIIITVVLTSLVFMVGYSLSIAKVYNYEENGFSITLPDDWIEIPNDIIAEYIEAIQKVAPELPRHNFIYGYQLSETENWFEHPYILIKIDREGRIPEDMLEEIELLDISKTLKEIYEDKAENIISNITFNNTVYDSINNIIWLKSQENAEDIGLVINFIGSILTDEGFIDIFCYSKEDDYNKYEPLFIDIIKSVVVDEHLRYNKQPTKQSAEDNQNIIYLIIIFGITSSITVFDKRLTQAKRDGVLPADEPELPSWVTGVWWLHWIIGLSILILNWQWAIIVFVVKFILSVLPVLETIGNLLMSPFKNRDYYSGNNN